VEITREYINSVSTQKLLNKLSEILNEIIHSYIKMPDNYCLEWIWRAFCVSKQHHYYYYYYYYYFKFILAYLLL